jgi:hypothetical protein
MHAVKTCARRTALLGPIKANLGVDIVRIQEVAPHHDAVASLVRYNYAPSYILESSAAKTRP